jgi:dTDP-4-amino-4,6-dideoxygalactose transaminase
METILAERKRVVDFYNQNLNLDKIQTLKIRANTQWNYSYFPVVFKDEATLLQAQKDLNAQNIFPRRYFFPSLNTVGYLIGQKMPVSESIAARVLCLPLYNELTEMEIFEICSIINNTIYVI